jgi:hypothetical protein
MIVTVCGLHGGAGTTTIASLLASAGAAQRPGRVLLADTAPGAGDLALAHQATSRHSLTDLAHLHDARRVPNHVPWHELDTGVRLLAHAPARRRAARQSAISQVLRDADATHDLVVIDAGAITDEHACGALTATDVVLWTLDATAIATHCAHLLSGELTAPACRARWKLVVSATGRDAIAKDIDTLHQLMPSASQIAYLPAIAGLTPDAQARSLAGEQLLSALNWRCHDKEAGRIIQVNVVPTAAQCVVDENTNTIMPASAFPAKIGSTTIPNT